MSSQAMSGRIFPAAHGDDQCQHEVCGLMDRQVGGFIVSLDRLSTGRRDDQSEPVKPFEAPELNPLASI